MIGRIIVYYENPDSTVVTGAILPVPYEGDFKIACKAVLLDWGTNEARKAFEDEYGLEDKDIVNGDFDEMYREFELLSTYSYEVIEEGEE